MKYNNLQDLLSSDNDAKQYFNNLPLYAREHIGTRQNNVRSFDELRRFAENYLQGDK